MPEMRARGAPAECANCGAAIPRDAKACPECGADERTGWRETPDSIYDGLDLPEEESTDRAEAAGRRRMVNGIPWYWWCVGVAVLLGIAVLFLR